MASDPSASTTRVLFWPLRLQWLFHKPRIGRVSVTDLPPWSTLLQITARGCWMDDHLQNDVINLPFFFRCILTMAAFRASIFSLCAAWVPWSARQQLKKKEGVRTTPRALSPKSWVGQVNCFRSPTKRHAADFDLRRSCFTGLFCLLRRLRRSPLPMHSRHKYFDTQWHLVRLLACDALHRHRPWKVSLSLTPSTMELIHLLWLCYCCLI